MTIKLAGIILILALLITFFLIVKKNNNLPKSDLTSQVETKVNRHEKPTSNPQDNINPTSESKYDKNTILYKGKEYSIDSVGDMIGNLKVTQIDTHLNPPITNAYASFTVEDDIEISGNYRKYSDTAAGMDLLMNGYICIEKMLPSSENELPKHIYESRSPQWFCFSNKEIAKELFKNKSDTGAITVIISDYKYIFAGTEVFNTATLKSIVE